MIKQENKRISTKYSKLSKKAFGNLSRAYNDDEANNIINQFNAGTTNVLKYDRLENTLCDYKWIDEIENCLNELGQIVQNPKKVTRETAEVVPVELAKRINAQSVTHLATHSQYVKELKENGDVIPSKILNIGNDDFYQTYENRFIATLIRKLVLFVEKRYQFLLNAINVKKTKVLMVKNKSVIDGKEVEIETKVRITSDETVSEEQIKLNESYIERVKSLQHYLVYYYNSDFMKMMKTEKNVRNPIIMTNIIRKNPLYNKCYRLYRFIESYDLLGAEFRIHEQFDDLNEEKAKKISNTLLTSFLSMDPDETLVDAKHSKTKVFKPHMAHNAEDDLFVYGPLYTGPIDLVRVDKDYLQALKENNVVVPAHLNKREKEYYDTDIKLNKSNKQYLLELDRLLKRKDKENKQIEKYLEKIALQIEKEEELEKSRVELLRQKQIRESFEEERKNIIKNAFSQKENNN